MLGLGVIITLMVISSAFVLFQLNEVSISTETTLTTDVTAIDKAKHVQTILVDQERSAQKFLVSHDRTYYGLFSDGRRQFDSYMDSLLAVCSDTKEAALINQILHATHWFDDVIGQEGGDPRMMADSSDALLTAVSDSLGIIHAKLDQIIRLRQLAINNAMAAVETKTGDTLGVAFILTLWTLALAIILSLFIARTITRPIDTLIEGTENIARGSFEPIQVSSKDEIALLANAINQMGTKLKKINEYKAELLQQISHEVRSPLATILGAHFFLTNKRGHLLNDEQKKMLEIIHNSVEQVSNFSHQFLDVAKVEAGMMRYKFEDADVVALVRTVVKESELSALRKNIDVDFRPTSLPNIMIDIDKMKMVVGNLMSNAIKYTRKSGKIRVEVGPSDFGVRIVISDTGIGISESDLPHIFTRFYQAGGASKSGTSGTGVGLALVKAFSKGHGAKVSVESTLGVGSTFTIELPATPVNGKAGLPALKEGVEKTK